MNKWDKRFIELSYVISGWSKDPSTKCGAVIVSPDNRIISVGFNGFPKGTNDDITIYHDRPEKYRRVVHAEKNAILFAKCDLTDHTIYVVPMPPCSQCAGLIIQSGIKKVITLMPNKRLHERWKDEINTTMRMFKETNIELILITKQLTSG